MLICTGDRDAFQLVTDRVTVLYPRKGVSDLARMTPAAVEEKYFATPARYPELAALVGETSDNLPGVPGVGPKTAAKWLETYDGLENLVAHAGELKGKAAEAFQERTEDVLRNRQINALVRDLELPIVDRRPRAAAWNREATHQLFDGLEFRVLRDRLLESLPAEDLTPKAGSSSAERCCSRASSPAGSPSTPRRPDRHRRDRALGLGDWRSPRLRVGRG